MGPMSSIFGNNHYFSSVALYNSTNALMDIFICLSNSGHRRMSSVSSSGRLSPASKFWCTHMAHFLCKEVLFSCSEHVWVLSKSPLFRFLQVSDFASCCACFVWLLCRFCKELSEVVNGLRIPPPPVSITRCKRATENALRSLGERGLFLCM